MAESGKTPGQIIEKKGLKQITDEETLEKIVKTVIAANPGSAEDYKNGKTNAIRFLMGQVMKQTKGKANPGLARSLLEQVLGSAK
jgi:aspartyl-tRNA(Asn)/glutamyl-tRNA(Gln) amidotransferase subunit B